MSSISAARDMNRMGFQTPRKLLQQQLHNTTVLKPAILPLDVWSVTIPILVREPCNHHLVIAKRDPAAPEWVFTPGLRFPPDGTKLCG
jgi:hypothetical protein